MLNCTINTHNAPSSEQRPGNVVEKPKTRAVSTPAATYESILSTHGVLSFYQPLVSVKRRGIIGYEALSRGTLDGATPQIPPGELFGLAKEDPIKRLALDRLCRSKAFDEFVPIHNEHRSVLLSVNLDVAIIDTVGPSTYYLLKQVADRGIDPGNVLIEIIENEVENTEGLIRFVEIYRDLGFLIGLDDIGSGYSNLERIAQIKPDVIKVDKSLIHNIDKEFYKREVARSLVGLGQKIGAIILAEGVEREEEAVVMMDLGVDVFQGYFFARPAMPSQANWEVEEKLERVAESFKQHTMAEISKRKALFDAYDTVITSLRHDLASADESTFDAAMAGGLAYHPDVECIYILDERGVQVSNTICNPDRTTPSKRFLYEPARKGSDLSLKQYFLPIKAGLERYTTEPYISLASGNLCTTIAFVFTDKDERRRVGCVDIVCATYQDCAQACNMP